MTAGGGPLDSAATTALQRELERTALLAQAEAIRIEGLLDRLEALQAEADALARANAALCAPIRARIAEAFARLLSSAAWRIGRAIGDGVARVEGRPLWSLTEAAEAECRALAASEPAGDRDPWGSERTAQLERLQGMLTLLLGSRRFRVGRLLGRLLRWDGSGDRAALELACLLRAAREQASAAHVRRAMDTEAQVVACPR